MSHSTRVGTSLRQKQWGPDRQVGSCHRMDAAQSTALIRPRWESNPAVREALVQDGGRFRCSGGFGMCVVGVSEKVPKSPMPAVRERRPQAWPSRGSVLMEWSKGVRPVS